MHTQPTTIATGDLRQPPRPRVGRTGLVVVTLAIAAGLLTYAILTGLTPIQPGERVMNALLWANALLVLAVASLIGRQLFHLWRARRERMAGAGLHGRIVLLLSLFATVPALIVAVFGSVTLNRGLDAWFSARTEAIVERAISVAQTYIAERADLARLDTAGLAAELERQPALLANPQALAQRLALLASLRGLTAAFVFQPARRYLDAIAKGDPDVRFRPPPPGALAEADKGKIVVMGPGPGDNIIRALKKLEGGGGRYLYVYRAVNDEVIRQLAKARAEREEFFSLKKQRFGLQVTFALMYAGLSLILLMGAVWFGMWFADRLVAPLTGLIRAARQVARGNLDVRLPQDTGSPDIDTLLAAFNQMTRQLKAQREELLAAYHKLDERRRFTEAVLAGASAGVIGLDREGRVTLANRSALQLLDKSKRRIIGKPLEEVMPAFAPALRQARARKSGFAEDHIVTRVRGEERSFLLRVTTERDGADVFGYVLTFDDTTDLMTAQRNAAWADVARRIAHEIKNPLTPIQLSAERLKRRYAKEITNRPEIFTQCTDTIIRQVGDIGRMVDEFSAFARMPAAHLEDGDLVQTVKEALVLQKASSDDIAIETRLPEKPLPLAHDRRLISQAITNLVKNARESIEARLEKVPDPPGRIVVELTRTGEEARIIVTDNGVGLPREQRARLTEPYMTTREKGTGLGLAIVKRIMEEHGGAILLEDAPDGAGARITLTLSMHAAADPAVAEDGGRQREETSP